MIFPSRYVSTSTPAAITPRPAPRYKPEHSIERQHAPSVPTRQAVRLRMGRSRRLSPILPTSWARSSQGDRAVRPEDHDGLPGLAGVADGGRCPSGTSFMPPGLAETGQAATILFSPAADRTGCTTPTRRWRRHPAASGHIAGPRVNHAAWAQFLSHSGAACGITQTQQPWWSSGHFVGVACQPAAHVNCSAVQPCLVPVKPNTIRRPPLLGSKGTGGRCDR